MIQEVRTFLGKFSIGGTHGFNHSLDRFLTDFLRGHAQLSPGFFAGALAVLAGFQLESWEEASRRKPPRAAHDALSISPHLGPHAQDVEKDPHDDFCLSSLAATELVTRRSE